jgi:hypothetical protein
MNTTYSSLAVSQRCATQGPQYSWQTSIVCEGQFHVPLPGALADASPGRTPDCTQTLISSHRVTVYEVLGRFALSFRS